MQEKILLAREERIKIIKELQQKVVVLKANTIGKDKNINFAYMLVGYFHRVIVFSSDLKDYITNIYIHHSYDGPYIIYTIKDLSVKKIKEITITIEEEKMGRLVDIDVYDTVNNEEVLKSVNRVNPRKCLICNNDAFICVRQQTHSFDELYKQTKTIAYNELVIIVRNAIDKAMRMELDLYPKFGCVSSINNGSHPDMDYTLMEQAITVITPYFVKMFEVGYNTSDIDDIYTAINSIGKIVEDEMMKVCKVNCYKGLIFCLGILCSSLGYTITSKKNNNSLLIQLFNNTKIIAKNIFDNVQNMNTFGASAYIKYGFGGIRKEVHLGYPTVKKVYSELTSFDNKTLFKVFVSIVSNCEDTVLLKRSKTIDRYNEFKMLISNALTLSSDELEKLNERCIKENISLGGSADLLVCTIFTRLINNKIDLEV